MLAEEGKLFQNEQLTIAKKGESESQIELDQINSRFKCDCEKNALYDFSCKSGVTWFITNILIIKIRKKQKANPEIEV